MQLKLKFNQTKECVYAIVDFIKDLLFEDNLAPTSYYEIQTFLCCLGFPYQKIDVYDRRIVCCIGERTYNSYHVNFVAILGIMILGPVQPLARPHAVIIKRTLN